MSGWPRFEPTSTTFRTPPSSSSTSVASPAYSAIQLPEPERVLGLHHLVDLRRPLVDDRGPRIAEVALDRVLRGVAVRAVHLDRQVGRLERALGRVPLGERRLARISHALVLGGCRLHHEEARG